MNGQRHLRVVGDQRRGGVGVELQQGHRALAGQLGHQARAGGDHLQPVGGCQRPGHHGGRHFTHRVADHGVGRHPVGAPQRGQRQLDAHQHRLNAVDADYLAALGEGLAQRKATLGKEVGLELVDGRGERRLVEQ
jgi:hypothetical protein